MQITGRVSAPFPSVVVNRVREPQRGVFVSAVLGGRSRNFVSANSVVMGFGFRIPIPVTFFIKMAPLSDSDSN